MTPPAEGMSRGLSATTTSEIMVAAVVILFILSVVFFSFYLYHKRYHGAMPSIRSSRVNSILAVPGHGTVPRRALDPAVIKALPVVLFRSDDFNEGIECPVCLGELTEGEETRMLPECNHIFHLDCIDMWFHSNNTCPLCRSPVCSDPSPSRTQVTEAPAVEGNTTAARDFPSNVLVWGSGDRISTGVLAAAPASTHPESSSSSGSSSGKAEGVLVIEIPKRVGDEFSSANSPLPSSGLAEVVISSPMSARLRSLRRLLSRGGRGVGASRSPRVGDIEQGTTGVAPMEGSLQAPQIPTNSWPIW